MTDMSGLIGRLSARLCQRGAPVAAAAARLVGPHAPLAALPMTPYATEGAAGRLRHLGNTLRAQSSSVAAAAAGAASAAPAIQEAPPPEGYQVPPEEILQIVDAPTEPLLSFSPDRKLVLQLRRPSPMPPITELAKPELKLAGLRLDPETWSRSRMGYYLGLSLAPFTDDLVVPLAEGVARPVTGVPPGYWFNYVQWSPDSRHIAFTIRSAGGDGDPPRGPLQLWVADVATCQARPLLPELGLNAVFDDYEWVNADTIVATVVPPGTGPPPPKPAAPLGPRIEDNSSGERSQARTFTDLLQSPHDVQLFEHYTRSTLVTVKVSTGEVRVLGEPRSYTAASASPDGRFLLVSWLEPPYSYEVPCGRFAKTVELWDTATGARLHTLGQLPLATGANAIPIAYNSCRKGPRGMEWRDDKPAEVAWIECQDGGDPAVQTSPRDIVYTLPAEAAAAGEAHSVVATTDMRCGGVAWGGDDLSLLYESEWKTRRTRTWVIAPGAAVAASAAGEEPPKQLLFDRSFEDSYSDPGTPAQRRTPWGTFVLARLGASDGSGRQLIMQGAGASPQGNRPFLDVLDVDTRQAQRVWQSQPPYNEYTSSLLSDVEGRPIGWPLQLLASRESVDEPPQFYIMALAEDGTFTDRKLSDFPHPYPSLQGLQKEVITYRREDGVDLNATLYLPPGYDKGEHGPLPCLLSAYPREYKSKETAGQLRKSPHSFPGIGSSSPLLWLARNYAILDGPGFPILAEGEEEPNDSFVQQLVACAKAAVDEVVQRGVVDPARVAVTGHSYGAFMAANLLAHAPELFACGIARSGAYNRTLTPFGFQAEERTLWQARDVYMAMSPIMHADKISRPLLLIHGEADNNTGTFPMQSERLYQAIRGHGGVTRLVVLPHESHGYSARESVLHMLWEMDIWMERHFAAASSSDEGGNSAGKTQAEQSQGAAQQQAQAQAQQQLQQGTGAAAGAAAAAGGGAAAKL